MVLIILYFIYSHSCQTEISVNLPTKTTLNQEADNPKNSYELSETNVDTENGRNLYHIPSSGSITIASSDEAFIGNEVVIDIPSFNKIRDKEMKYSKGIQANQDKNNLYTLVEQKTGREFENKNYYVRRPTRSWAGLSVRWLWCR